MARASGRGLGIRFARKSYGQAPSAEIQATGAALLVQHPLAISRPAVDDGTDMPAEQEASRELAVQKEGLRGRLGKTVLLERLEASLT